LTPGAGDAYPETTDDSRNADLGLDLAPRAGRERRLI